MQNANPHASGNRLRDKGTDPASPIARRKIAVEAARQARRKCFDATKAIDDAIRRCTADMGTAAPNAWPEIVAELENAVAPVIAAAAQLPDADA